MTQFPTRFPAPRSPRRTKLLAASALCGVAAMLAEPASAGTLPTIPGAGDITVSSGGSQPLITYADPITLQVQLNASRTVINWSSLHVSSGDTLEFQFNASSDIVLNKTTSQIAIDNGGTVTGRVGAATGGNIWFYSPQGVIVSPGATMSAGGFVFAGGTGLIDANFVNAADPTAVLRAASNGLIRLSTVSSATSASVDASGNVVLSATSGALSAQTVYGATAQVSTTSGSITASEVTATSGAATVTAGGAGATVTQITGATGVTVSSNNNSSVGAATTTTSGDILITSNGSASLTLGNSARDLTLSAPQVFVSTIDAGRSVYLTATTSALLTNRIYAGDDIEITADGNVTAGSSASSRLRTLGTGSDDSHILLRSTTGSVSAQQLETTGSGSTAGDITVSAATSTTLTSASSSRNLTWTGGGNLALTGAYSAAGTVSLTSATGALNQTLGVVTANALAAEAAMGVSLTGANMINQVGDVQTLTGDVVLNNAKALTVAGDVGGRDIAITTTAGDLTVNSDVQIVATRDLDLTGATGLTVNTGLGGLLSAGGDATLTATTGDVAAISLSSGGSALVQALSGRATLRRASMTGGGDLTISATGRATLGADTPLSIGASDYVNRTGGAGTINVTSSGGDAMVFLDSLTGGGLTSVTASNTVGTAWIVVDGGFDVGVIEGFSAYLDATNGTINATSVTLGGGDYTAKARDWNGAALPPGGTIRNLTIIDTDGGLALAGALTASGNLRLESYDILTSAYDLAAGGDVTVMAAGDIDLASATAGDDITVQSFGGQAILRKADLAGAGAARDLRVTASGNAVLGDPDYTAITSDNVFTRSGGGAGTAEVKSTNGSAMVHLDTSAAIDTVEGADVDITIASGPGVFGALTATTGDVYAEVLDGAMTVGTVTAASGDVSLYDAGGDLTITGSVHGGGLVHVETDGLLDGRLASLISSDGDLELIGGAVELGHVTAGGMLEASAMDTDLTVQLAEAGQTVVVASLYGDATLRGAKAPDGVVVLAANTATFGADDKASITAANYVDTNAASGGLGGLQVLSFDGDAVVNIDSATNGVALVGASIGGSATVVQKTGDLKIDEIAAYNITIEAMGGSLETGSTITSGGDYAITAQAFLGDALTPTLFNGVIRDVAITDTLGDLDLGTAAIHADRKLTIVAQDGAVLGLAQLSAGSGLGDGDIDVSGQGVALDTVAGDGSVTLDGGTGQVNVAGDVTVGGDYVLAGGGFSIAALSPLGAKAGDWTIDDKVGDLDFTGASMRYGGDITLTAVGGVTGGDITSDNGDIRVTAASGQLGALNAATGQVRATASVGGMTLVSAKAADLIEVSAATGAAGLGAAVLTGTGSNSLLVQSANGDVTLGAATPGAVTTANLVTSAGASTVVEASSANGKVGVHLDRTDTTLTTLAARDAVTVVVSSGPLTIGQLTAGGASEVRGGGDTRLVSADVDGDLLVSSGSGALRLGDAAPGRVIEASGALSLEAATDIAQQGVLKAASLGVVSGTGVTLLGVNEVARLDAVSVAAGGFAFNSTTAFDIDGPITATGQTVDLRSGGSISQAATGIITAQRLTGSSVGGADFGAANQVVQLGDFSNVGGRFRLIDDHALTIDGTVHSTGTVSLASHGGMAFSANGKVAADGAGDAVILASDGVFANGRGADAVSATNAGGRWLIYTQAFGDPTGSTAGNSLGGLAGKSFYGSAYDFSAETFALTPNAGNRFVYAYQPILSVTPVSQVVTYNGAIPSVSATVTGLQNGDAAADAWSGTPVVSGATSKNAGTYVLTASGSLTSDLNYGFAYGVGSLRIDPKTLGGLLTADDKTYDRTTNATGAITLSGVVTGDDVSAAGAYTFDDRNAGAGKTVTASAVALSGADAGNYVLAPLAAAQAEIFRKTLTGALSADNKTYDGTTTATGSIGLTGVIAGDAVSAGGTYAFADKTAASGKTVTASGTTLSGADAANYTLTGVSAAQADILKKSITGALTADNKTYDGATTATGSVALTGVIAGDAVSAGGTYAFADKTAANGKIVTASGTTLSGADAANYTLSGVSTGQADILRKTITGALTANDKTYDGATTATGSIALTGLVAGDTVSAAGTYNFADRNAGSGKAVTASGVTLAGADAANYDLSAVSGDLADILRRQVSVSADGQFKPFGQVDPTLTYRITVGSLATGDSFSGLLARAAGEAPGDYAISRGTLGLSANYDLTFTGAVFTIERLPAIEQEGSIMLKHVTQSPDFTLDWDPEPNLETTGPACEGEGCPRQTAGAADGRVVAALP